MLNTLDEIIRHHDAEQPQHVVERVANALLRVRGNSGQYGGSNRRRYRMKPELPLPLCESDEVFSLTN